MKKLENVKGVQTLSFEEVRKIEGGNWGTGIGVFMLFVYFYNEKEDFVKGFKDGFR